MVNVLGFDARDEVSGAPLRPQDLTQEPLNLSAHYSLMVVLLKARSESIVSGQKVVTLIGQYAPYNAAQEMPFDLEDALLLWLNKTCGVVNGLYIGSGGQPSRSLAPLVSGVRQLNTGVTIAATIAYFAPRSLDLAKLRLFPSPTITQDESARQNYDMLDGVCQRLGCPIPITAEDFVQASSLVRPVLVLWLCHLFDILRERSTTDRLSSISSATVAAIEDQAAKGQDVQEQALFRSYRQAHDTTGSGSRPVSATGPISSRRSSRPGSSRAGTAGASRRLPRVMSGG